jgi:hypothetical protein
VIDASHRRVQRLRLAPLGPESDEGQTVGADSLRSQR